MNYALAAASGFLVVAMMAAVAGRSERSVSTSPADDASRWRGGRIERFAGTARPGYGGDGGAALRAQLNGPAGLAIDREGNVYVADLLNHAVRRIDADSHRVETVAGCGQAGFSGDGASARSARLRSPEGVGVDRNGGLWIADSGNHRVRFVDAETGLIRTVAGTGGTSFNGFEGDPLAINLNHPSGIAVDEHGTVYVGDYGNDVIRGIDARLSRLTTLVGTGEPGYSGDGGPARAARLNDVFGIGLSPGGDLYIADSLNFAIRRVARATGSISTVVGKGRPGPVVEHGAASDTFLGGQAHRKGTIGGQVAHGVDVDRAGNVFVAETGEHRLRMLHKRTGRFFTVAGSGVSGIATEGQPALSAPLDIHGVRVDAVGNLYYVDFVHHIVNVVRF